MSEQHWTSEAGYVRACTGHLRSTSESVAKHHTKSHRRLFACALQAGGKSANIRAYLGIMLGISIWDLAMRTASTWLVVFLIAVCPALGQEGQTPDDVSRGHFLAITICATCHVAGTDQPRKPMMQPPAPSFDSIAQRKDVTAASLETYMNTTHRGLDNQNGMPNPDLMDYQVKQVAAYLLSLRK